MTTTTVLSAQSVGTSTNIGPSKVFGVAQKVTIATGSMGFVVTGQLTSGAGDFTERGNRIRIWFASSPVSLTYTEAPAQLNETARYLDIAPKPASGAITIKSGILEDLAGPYIYFWFDIAKQPAACTLTVYVTELP